MKVTRIHCIKIGGSLSSYTEELIDLMQSLDKLSKLYQLVIIPGGGPFADVVREIHRQYNLSECNRRKLWLYLKRLIRH